MAKKGETKEIETELFHYLISRRESMQRLIGSLPMPLSRFTKFWGLDESLLSAKPRFDTTLKFPFEEEEGVVITFIDGKVAIRKGSQILEKHRIGIHSLRNIPNHLNELDMTAMLFSFDPRDKLEALHVVNTDNVLFLYFPDNTKLEVPIYIGIQAGAEGATYSHLVIYLGKNSEATVVEEVISNGDVGYLSHFGEVYLDNGSKLNYGDIEGLGNRFYLTSRKYYHIGADAKLMSSFIWMGAKLVHSRVNTFLEGEGAEAEDTEVFYGTKRQHFDLNSNLRHSAPYTKGFALMQGLLTDRARGVLQGMIRIEHEGRGANSYLEEHALLLSKKAHANAEPALEILTDDVRASHSATVTRIEDEKIFYLQSRGLDRKESIKLIARGYLEPVYEKVHLNYLRSRLDELFDSKWDESKG